MKNFLVFAGDFGTKKLAPMKYSALAEVKVANTQRYCTLKFSDGKDSLFKKNMTSIEEGYVHSDLYHLLSDV